MNIKNILLLLSVLLYTTGCYGELRGKVVDAETGEPIKGAIVLVEWLTTKGLPGFTHTESSKIIEAVTDKEGMFTIADASKNTPHVTIYKKGYVAWNSKYIFPDYKKRTDFKWGNGLVFRLKRFTEGYSYDKHVSFIRSSIGSSQNLEGKKQIFDAFEWERALAQAQRKKKGLRP